MRNTAVFIVAHLWCSLVAAQDTAPSKKVDLMPVQQVEKLVTFIYVTNDLGEEVPNGTGFFVMVRGEKLSYGYIITAKHVLMHGGLPLSKKPAGMFESIRIRVNKKDGGVEMVERSLTKPNSVFFHRDHTVDLAAIPFFPDPKKYDAVVMDETSFATKTTVSEMRVVPGDNVLFGALFTPFTGTKKSYPIMRFGKIAMLPEEKIPMTKDLSVEGFLVEAQSYGGNSGAPVFFEIDESRKGGAFSFGAQKLLFAGVMHGYYNHFSPLVRQTARGDPGVNENSGIAIVVPAYLVSELIHQFELKLVRGE